MGLTETYIFEESGPSHLTDVKWTEDDHKRSVGACLVQGVYMIERDRKKGLKGPEALAPPWWNSFHFELVEHLVDVDSIFGAVFKYAPSHETKESPRYVIAFRGTLLRSLRDIKLDLRIYKNSLHHVARYSRAIEAVANTVKKVTEPEEWPTKVWLVGHSLGSSLALLAGREMARTGIFLTSFLFNPPFASTPIEIAKPKIIKHGIRFARTFAKAGVALLVKGRSRLKAEEAGFAGISGWVPDLFVNQRDVICLEYKGYFEQRRVMENMWMGRVEDVATRNSIKGLFMCKIGEDSHEPMHHIPSARLIANAGGPLMNAIDAHRLSQWWKLDLRLDTEVYKYKSVNTEQIQGPDDMERPLME